MKPTLPLAAFAILALSIIQVRSAAYTVNGWTISVSVAPDAPSIMFGEPTWLSFKVENLSDEDLQMIVGGDYRNEFGRPNSFKIRVTEDDGHEVPQPEVRFEAGGFIGPQPLPARSNYVFRLFVPDWARFERPGVYAFVCQRTLQLLRPQPDHSWKNTTNVDVSAKTELTVTPHDSVRMGEVIERLGERLLARTEPRTTEARKELASIHDDRAVPIWLKSQQQNTYDAKFHALNTLGEYPTQEAVDALKRALDLKGDDFPNCCTTVEGAESLAKNIRAVAAHSLAKNKNPDARKFLLDRRHDRDDELRLTVVHMLGREKSDESTSILKEMTADTKKLVKSEAERYLKERGASGIGQ